MSDGPPDLDASGVPSSEAEPAPRSSSAARGSVLLVIAAAAVVALPVLLGLLVGDGAPAPGTPSASHNPSTSTSSTLPKGRSLNLTALSMKVEGLAVSSPGGALKAFPADIRKAVVGTVRDYVVAATYQPLLPKGAYRPEKPIALASLFTDRARPRLSGPDRETLMDAGLAPAVGGFSVKRAGVRLSALGNEDGSVALVTAKLDVGIDAYTADGPVLITRSGELLLVPEGKAWLIDGYRLTVDRELNADAAAASGL